MLNMFFSFFASIDGKHPVKRTMATDKDRVSEVYVPNGIIKIKEEISTPKIYMPKMYLCVWCGCACVPFVCVCVCYGVRG